MKYTDKRERFLSDIQYRTTQTIELAKTYEVFRVPERGFLTFKCKRIQCQKCILPGYLGIIHIKEKDFVCSWECTFLNEQEKLGPKFNSIKHTFIDIQNASRVVYLAVDEIEQAEADEDWKKADVGLQLMEDAIAEISSGHEVLLNYIDKLKKRNN